MPRVGIVTDSTCDLGPEQLKELDVVMVPLTVHFGAESYRDWIDMTPEEFYPRLASFPGPGLPTTSQPSPADFQAAYAELADRGIEEVVVVTLSSALSGTYESAVLATKDSPVPVRIVDSKLASQGAGLIVKAAAELRDSGKSAADLEAELTRIAAETRLFFILDTLEFLVKGGRAGKATGLAASLLNIKPVLEVNKDGIIEPFKKVRGRSQAIAALAQHVADDSKKNGRMRLVLLHGRDSDTCDELEKAILDAGADVEIDSHGIIGAVIGVYTGPGAVGAGYYPIG